MGVNSGIPETKWSQYLKTHGDFSAENIELALKSFKDPNDKQVKEAKEKYEEDQRKGYQIGGEAVALDNEIVGNLLFEGQFTSNAEGLFLSYFGIRAITPEGIRQQLVALQRFIASESGGRINRLDMNIDSAGGFGHILSNVANQTTRFADENKIDPISASVRGLFGSAAVDLGLYTRETMNGGRGYIEVDVMVEAFFHSGVVLIRGYPKDLRTAADNLEAAEVSRDKRYVARITTLENEGDFIKMMNEADGLKEFTGEQLVAIGYADKVTGLPENTDSGNQDENVEMHVDPITGITSYGKKPTENVALFDKAAEEQHSPADADKPKKASFILPDFDEAAGL